MFYEYYPLFNTFSGMITDLIKNNVVSEDCLSDSLIEDLNIEYGKQLVQYAYKLYPLVKNNV